MENFFRGFKDFQNKKNPFKNVYNYGERTRKNNIKNPMLLTVIFTVMFVFLLFYISLPPINPRSSSFWMFLIFSIGIFTGLYSIFSSMSINQNKKIISYGMRSIVGILIFIFVMNILGSPIFNAKKYSKLIKVVPGDFAKDVKEVNFDRIPRVDRSTAIKLGAKKLGEMSSLVSQFDIDESYNQINQKGVPVRVTPLRYESFIKWFSHHNDGIKYYVSVDMTTQEAKLNKLEKPIYYSESDKFQRNIRRHIRFKRPTYIFNEVYFEIDDDGNPKWVVPILKPKIMLFSGLDSDGVLVVDANSGEIEEYDIKDTPAWVDRAYPSDLVFSQLEYNGKYKNGFFNLYLSQKGVTKPSEGYNYLSIDEDIYLYTGITSVTGDESNIGFVLINMRTKETKFYALPSAEEVSVMKSAAGKVQEKGYDATFPILINMKSRPTYFMALKDKADLTKMYSLVDAQSYQKVAVGETLTQVIENYAEINSEILKGEDQEKVIKVAEIIPTVVGGETQYFIKAEGESEIYTVKLEVNSIIPFIKPQDELIIKGLKLKNSFNITELKKK